MIKFIAEKGYAYELDGELSHIVILPTWEDINKYNLVKLEEENEK